jgi:ribonucleoside-diphosphate reductase alpha chain
MWKNKEHYTGISVLPYDGGTYVQAPFESCSKEIYEKLLEYVKGLDLKSIVEKENNTNLIEQSACAGGACEIK